MWRHAIILYDLRLPDISGIKAEILSNLVITLKIQGNHTPTEQFVENRAIVSIGAGHDD